MAHALRGIAHPPVPLGSVQRPELPAFQRPVATAGVGPVHGLRELYGLADETKGDAVRFKVPILNFRRSRLRTGTVRQLTDRPLFHFVRAKSEARGLAPPIALKQDCDRGQPPNLLAGWGWSHEGPSTNPGRPCLVERAEEQALLYDFHAFRTKRIKSQRTTYRAGLCGIRQDDYRFRSFAWHGNHPRCIVSDI